MADLASEIERHLKRAKSGAVLWSTAYHGSGTISLVASAGAAFVAAANPAGLSATQTSWVAALAGSAATLTAISTFIGFSGKWRANRKTRTALRRLSFELETEGQTDALRNRFFRILDAHDDAIEGAEPV